MTGIDLSWYWQINSVDWEGSFALRTETVIEPSNQHSISMTADITFLNLCSYSLSGREREREEKRSDGGRREWKILFQTLVLK